MWLTKKQADSVRLRIDQNLPAGFDWLKAHGAVAAMTYLDWEEVCKKLKGAQRIVYAGEYTYATIHGRDYELDEQLGASLRYWLDNGQCLRNRGSRNGVPIVYATH
jgi:hypothetical protein